MLTPHRIHRARPPRRQTQPEQPVSGTIVQALERKPYPPPASSQFDKKYWFPYSGFLFSRRPDRFDAAGSLAFQGFTQGLYQQFFAEGFTQEGHCPGGQCLLADSELVVRRDKNQWDRAAGHG